MLCIQPGQNQPLSGNKIVLRVTGEPKDNFVPNTQLGVFRAGPDGRAASHRDFIHENNARSHDGAIVFDALQRECRIDLGTVATGIERIAIVLAIRGGLGPGTTIGTFADVRTLLADERDGPILEFSLPLASRHETALILAEVYRYRNQWKFRAVGQGFRDGLTALASHFGLRYEEPTPARNLPQPDQRDRSPHGRTAFSGTGFCVSAEGYFITNHHVVENALEIRARSPTEHYPLRHVFSDPANDLALLKATAPCPKVAVFRAGAQAQPGEGVVVIGYPLNGLLGSSPQVTTGNVSSLIGIGDDTRGLQFTAPVQRGNSGGPLLDSDGAVVGVVSAKLDVARIHALTGDVPQNVNFAIKSAVVRNFLEAIGVGYASRPSGSPRQPPEIAAEAQHFVFRIDCSA